MATCRLESLFMTTLKPLIPIDSANIFYQNQRYLSFCSHDYLGLSEHPDVKKSAMKFLLQYGMSATSYEDPHFIHLYQMQLEEKWAEALLKESVLFFPSTDAVLSLFAEQGALFIDSELAPFHKAAYFEHANLNDLEILLKKSSSPLKIIATHSIFGLGGDLADLKGISALSERYGALLYVDDSHSLGIFGKDGMGLSTHEKGINIIAGSLNKGCGLYGSYIGCDKEIRDFLVEHLGVHLLPAPIIGGLECALDLIRQMEGERQQLQQRAYFLRKELKELGFELIASNAPLISILFSSEEEAISFRKNLLEAQIFVASQKSFGKQFVVQICLTNAHMPDHVNQLICQAKRVLVN